MYQNGNGVTQDYTKAMEYFLKSANQGDSAAQYNIGIHSFHSNIVLTIIIDLNRGDVSRWRWSNTRLHPSAGVFPQEC